MRVVVGLLFASLLVAPASAFSLEDPLGDLEHSWFGQNAALRESPYADLVGLTIEETLDTFDFTITMGGPEPDQDVQDNYGISLYMTHGTQQYRAYIGKLYAVSLVPSGEYFLDVTRIQEDGRQFIAGQEMTPGPGVWKFSVNRELFLDEVGAPPAVGEGFTDIYVETRGGTTLAPGPAELPLWHRYDRMPDQEMGAMNFTFGQAQMGAKLVSSDPFRMSNGEAGTFYFPASLLSEQDNTYTFNVKELPNGWTVRVPFSELEVAAGKFHDFDVEVTIPFGHAHGTTQSFILESKGLAAQASQEFGITFVDPPQPSGHHPKMWIHSFDGSSSHETDGLVSRDLRMFGYMNAREEDPSDSLETIEPSGSSVSRFGLDPYQVEWRIPLAPGLRMGLNVTDAATPISIQIDSPIAHDGVVLTGELVSALDGEETPIATISSPTQTLASGTTTLEGKLTGIPGITPYSKGTSLMFKLTLTTATPEVYLQHSAPYLLPGSWLQLPLSEYQESIADASGFVQPQTAAPGISPEKVPDKKSPGAGPLAVLFCMGLARRITVTFNR